MLHYKDQFETDGAKIVRLCIGALGVNTYLLICRKTRDAAVIDPGGEEDAIAAAVNDEGAHLTHIIFTHLHIDHIYGAERLHNMFPDAQIVYHCNEKPVLEAIPGMCRMFELEVRTMPPQTMDLSSEPEFSLGALQVRSILTPGHTPGGICYYIPEEKLMFSGDTLFKRSVGRTDFEGGSGVELRKSLDRLLEILPDDVKILPGHGKYTEMGDERHNNFYLKVDRWR